MLILRLEQDHYFAYQYSENLDFFFFKGSKCQGMI